MNANVAGENFFPFPSVPACKPTSFPGLSSPGNEGVCIQASRILCSVFSGRAPPCCKVHVVGNEQKEVVLRTIWRKEIGIQDYIAPGGREGWTVSLCSSISHYLSFVPPPPLLPLRDLNTATGPPVMRGATFRFPM